MRVAVTCGHLKRDIELFRPELEASGLEVVLPEVPGQELAGDELVEAMQGMVGVIGGDDQFIEFPAKGSPLVNVLEKGFSQERMEGLSGEAGRGPAGRDDTNDSCLFVVNYNPPSAVSQR